MDIGAESRRDRTGDDRLGALPADALLPLVPGAVALLSGDGTILDVAEGPDGGVWPRTVGRRIDAVLPTDLATGLLRTIQRALADERGESHRYVHAAGEGPGRRRETTVRAVGPDRVVAIARDVEIERHGHLTGLPDRSTLHARLDRSLARRTGRPAALFVDVDNFKRVNESLGYSRGDETIVAMADRIGAVAGHTSLVSHVGGDEFVVVLDDVADDAEALDLATRLRLAIASPLPLGTGTVHLTACVGIALADDHTTADALLRDADAALHHAKASGRNRHVLYDPSLRGQVVDRVELEAALHNAIADGELCVHYQPVIDLSTGATVGVEALVRWDRPGYGLVPPDAFVPVAEQAGIINELGAFVLRHAVHDAARWHPSAGLNVAVNVSAAQLTEPGLAHSVLDALAESGLPADALSLELTETAYTSASDAAVAALQLVRESGVRIALDDFGSGYSSLDRVRRFPIDVIKIDRESVIALPNGERDVTIVRAMIELAHALGVPVVAEGVEELEMHDALVRLGCDLAQGYLYARPLPPEELAERLGIVTPSGARRPR